jgi:hypothetical protein
MAKNFRMRNRLPEAHEVFSGKIPANDKPAANTLCFIVIIKTLYIDSKNDSYSCYLLTIFRSTLCLKQQHDLSWRAAMRPLKPARPTREILSRKPNETWLTANPVRRFNPSTRRFEFPDCGRDINAAKATTVDPPSFAAADFLFGPVRPSGWLVIHEPAEFEGQLAPRHQLLKRHGEPSQ